MCQSDKERLRQENGEQLKEVVSNLNLWGAGQYYMREVRPDSPENIRLLFVYYALISEGARKYRERKVAEAARAQALAKSKPENAS